MILRTSVFMGVKIMMYKHILILVFSWLTLLSCDRERLSLKDNKNIKEQSLNEKQSLFSLVHSDGKKILGLNKQYLNIDFMLRTNLIEGGESPTFSSLKTRIVNFNHINNEIILVESEEGHVYHYDIPQSFVLAKFIVESEDDNYIYFDFNEGLQKVFLMKDWYAHDFSGVNHQDISMQHKNISLSRDIV